MNWKTVPGFLLAVISGWLWVYVLFTVMAVKHGMDVYGEILWPLMGSLVLLSVIAAATTWAAVRLCRTK